MDPAQTPKEQLFVFFPGSGAVPMQYQLLLREAAHLGYYSVGLNYPNSISVGKLCKRERDPDCYGAVRQEVFSGQDATALVDVSRSNSITNRLTKLLDYLHDQQPTAGWDR